MIQKSNPRHSKSQYEKYVIMAHSQTHRLPLSYDGYLRFKELMEVLNSISNSSSDSKQFLFGGEMLTKKVSQTEALTILDNIYNGTWNATTEKCLLVANHIGMNLKR